MWFAETRQSENPEFRIRVVCGKNLGLLAAPLVGNAVNVPPLQLTAVQCNAVSQPGSQSDSHPMRVAHSRARPWDLTGKSREGDLSSGHIQSPIAPTALSPQPNAEPLDNWCIEGE